VNTLVTISLDELAMSLVNSTHSNEPTTPLDRLMIKSCTDLSLLRPVSSEVLSLICNSLTTLHIYELGVSSHLKQHIRAAVVRPKHEVEANLNFVPPPEFMSLEISTHTFAQVITLPTSTRVQ